MKASVIPIITDERAGESLYLIPPRRENETEQEWARRVCVIRNVAASPRKEPT